jgi:hypothetical protein
VKYPISMDFLSLVSSPLTRLVRVREKHSTRETGWHLT